MKNFTLAILFIANIHPLYSQSIGITIGKIIPIQSQVLNEQRQLAIYTPEGHEDSGEKYPVLYLLDAEWNFHYVTGVAKQLAASGDAPEMIIVGLINTSRNRDLTPSGTNDNPNRFGGAAKFLEFITTEVQPYIEQNFRVHPYRIIAGHSFGGLFSIYAMAEQPDFFQAYIALSSSLGRNDGQQLKKVENWLQNSKVPQSALFFAIGNEGGHTYLSNKKLERILNSNASTSLEWKFSQYKEANHVSVTIRGFLEGLEYIFEGFNPESNPALEDIFLVEKHFEGLSNKYGYPFTVPERFYEQFTREQIGLRDLDYAFYILKKYETLFPNSPQMLLAYADALLLNGDFEEAKKYYRRLARLEPENEELRLILKNLGK